MCCCNLNLRCALGYMRIRVWECSFSINSFCTFALRCPCLWPWAWGLNHCCRINMLQRYPTPFVLWWTELCGQRWSRRLFEHSDCYNWRTIERQQASDADWSQWAAEIRRRFCRRHYWGCWLPGIIGNTFLIMSHSFQRALLTIYSPSLVYRS